MVDRIIGSSRIAPIRPPNPEIARLPGPASCAPLRLVIDTNLWLDLLVFRDPGAGRLAALLAETPRERIALSGCDGMRAELADVVARPQFRLDADDRAEILRSWDARVDRHPPAPDCALACTDRDDLKFLNLAIAQRAHWLLSRDRALLAARKSASRRFALRIGTLPDFYNWLDDTGTAPNG